MQIITNLEATKRQTLQYFELPDSLLSKTYAEGKWNIRQLLHHLADAETVLYDRIRRGISVPGQVVWGFDQDAWADKLNYQHLPLEINKQIYLAVRESIIYLANEYYDRYGHHEYVHSGTGLRTVKDEFDKVAWHNQHHLDQIAKALKT